jgi:8-oxo-dGTP diphosphatase
VRALLCATSALAPAVFVRHSIDMADLVEARAPTLAAGGIVFRESARPHIAIVRLRKDKSWVLPKGKLYPGERALDAARREVVEETGHEVSVHEFLGSMSYPVDGKIKIVQFWHMRAVRGPTRKLAYEIKTVKWLPLKQAIEMLTRVHERVFLAHVGPVALKAMQSMRDGSIKAASRNKEKRASRRSSIAPVEQSLAAG